VEGLRRHFTVAVNAEALALAWARQDAAPIGATVVVDHEISPRGRLGRLWQRPSDRTVAMAMVWRPQLAADAADLIWSAASLGLLRAMATYVDPEPLLLWPDEVVDDMGRVLGAVRAEIQLAPGRVASAIVTARVDLDTVGRPERGSVLAAVDDALVTVAAQLDTDAEMVRDACTACSALAGCAVIAHLLPRGEVRGAAQGIDASGALQLVSSTGLRQRVPIVSFDRLTVGRLPR